MKLSKIILGERKKQDISQKWADDKGPFKKGDEWQEISIVTEQDHYLGFDSFAVESLTKYLQKKYSESEDYILHIGQGDDFANALTILNRELTQDKVLMTLIDLAKDESIGDPDADNYYMQEHETDPGLELQVGDYKTKHYHMCPGAKSLYQDIESKVDDIGLAVRAAKLQDALFAMEETALDRGATEADLFAAETIADQIMEMARMMELEKEHSYIQGHVDKIKGTVKEVVGEKKRPGLWANINAKKKRGEKPSHGNSKAHKDAVAAGKAIKK